MATTRVEERVLSAFGLPAVPTIRFEPSRSIPCGGVMLWLPFLIEMLEKEIIPELLRLHVVGDDQQEKMATNPDYPLFTLVFDREAYSPALFSRLWKNHRIAILTYRKHVKDDWDEALFEEETVETRLGETTMKLHEEETVLDGHPLREVRRLTSSGHQTSIITTNRHWPLALIAAYMFGRWVQENFFRYMRQEYSIDKIIQYAVDELDESFMVVNREYGNIQYKIKKMREKRSRVKAVTHLSIDLIPDETNKQLNITLYPLPNGRSQKAVSRIMEDVNDTKTLYPGTDWVMNFKFAT